MPIMNADPHRIYWLADDARLFSGSTETIVPDTDPAYLAWLAEGFAPSSWPRELDDAQTDAALQQVLNPYGMFASLEFYSISIRDKTLGGGITVNGKPFATDPITLMSLNSAVIYTANKTTTDEYSWKLPDGTFVTLNKAEVEALQNAVAKLGQDCFECEVTLLEGMDAATVTTRQQVDAAYAAIQTDFTAAVTYKVRRQKR